MIYVVAIKPAKMVLSSIVLSMAATVMLAVRQHYYSYGSDLRGLFWTAGAVMLFFLAFRQARNAFRAYVEIIRANFGS